MKNFKFYERTIAGISTAVCLLTMAGCTKKVETKEEVSTTDYSSYVTVVNNTENGVQKIIVNVDKDMKEDTSIILLLDVLAKKDVNGKINADVISQFKSKIDSDNMMDEFNSFLDIVQAKMIKENKVINISEVLPKELNDDKKALAEIEKLLAYIMRESKNNNKEVLEADFDALYNLFVKENEMTINDVTFEIRDLSYASREVANMYAETAITYLENTISKDKLSELDKRTNDQSSKAYIRETLNILSNEMEEKSKYDVKSQFDEKYNALTGLTAQRVITNDASIKQIVNILNLEYLDSDDVSYADKNAQLGEYNEEKVKDSIITIDAITKYNNTKDEIIGYSDLLIKNNETDKTALDYVQYNTIMIGKCINNIEKNINVKENVQYLEVYYGNIYKYLTKQDIKHTYEDKEVTIKWQDISYGVNFVNDETIRETLLQLKDFKAKHADLFNGFTMINFDEAKGEFNSLQLAERNLGESITYVEETYTNECKKVDVKKYIKK